MKVKLTNGRITVHYFPKHENHENELEHLRLLQSDRAAIAGKLKEGVSETRILGDIRDEVNIDSGRKILIDKKDIQNIKRDFNINGVVSRHQNDAISVRLWVQEMVKQDNCVIYFKEQGKEDDSSLLKVEDFVLIIMTTFQKEMIRKYGGDKICLDGTHGLNNYDFSLYSMLVIDKFKNGCPVAFCFSNRSSEQLFIVFFSAVKNTVGTITCTTFMTDDAPAFYNAWFKVMNPVSNVLLCAWHVTRNWQQNLCKIKNLEKKKMVYKAAKTIRDELCEETFSKLLEGFVCDLFSDEDTVEFGKYILQHYASRTERWAYCYRKHLGINTNMHLESQHKKIKYQYLEGRHVKRLDIAINGLLKLVRDLIFQRLIKVTKKSVPSDRINRIVKSHKVSSGIMPEMITILSNDEWHIKSMSGNNVYNVHKVEEECGGACYLKCAACEVCIHLFTCTCVDYVIRGNICKHIHSIALIHKRSGRNSTVMSEAVATTSQENFLKETLDVLPTTCGTNTVNSSIRTKLESILSDLDECRFTTQESNVVHKSLNNVFNVCNENIKVNCATQLKEVSHMNTRKKIKKQTGYFSTKVKKYKTATLNNPTVKEPDNVKEGLLSKSEVICINADFDHTYNK
ncbi:uncharacterized protein [Periplaneta americana]|uniref:uncharacterized protein n=1 Tax=Periplaneta americana TaxID=6978 RepID=UPI0037E8A46E